MMTMYQPVKTENNGINGANGASNRRLSEQNAESFRLLSISDSTEEDSALKKRSPHNTTPGTVFEYSKKLDVTHR